VCGTYVAPGTAPFLTARGEIHYFCSEQCRAEYRHRR
jgi:YHS domain-containing protein